MLVFAHRGVSAHLPENTFLAFDAALKGGANGLETDLRLSGDGVVVLHHDPAHKFSSGREVLLTSHAYKTLKKLGEPENFILPTLEDFWQRFSGKIPLNLEVKEEAVFPLLVDFLKTRPKDNLIITSGLWEELGQYRHLFDGVIVGPVVEAFDEALLLRTRPDIISLDRGVFTPKMVADAHGLGCKLFLWTVNEPADGKYLKSEGVDGVFSDDPLLLLNNLFTN
jgi:glycerophosphoryl diester phosphodiesterase